ncbi:MAG: tRNA (guanine-N1)-methyltransferase [Desulfurococcales archaeon]|nr:tRNA (guanine-N1)-methyltransferase [Desulfurococcales archaeon]
MKREFIEVPGNALLELLYRNSVFKLGSTVWLSRKKLAGLGFQYIAVEALVREHVIAEDPTVRGGEVYNTIYRDRLFSIFYPPGDHLADASLTPKPDGRKVLVSWMDLQDMLPNPPLPVFVIDLSLKFIHTEEEATKLKVQIAMSLSVIREYLWDAHLALTGVESGSTEWISDMVGYNKMTVTQNKPSELLWGLDADKVIILRPDAPQPLSRDDVLEADGFLIGGIVDKIPRPGLSRMLDNLVPWGMPRRLELRGSVIGVPERINRIIEILLKSRYMYNGDIEKAIVSTMTRKDVVSRAYVEIARRAARRGSVSWDLYRELKAWLPIRKKDFLEAAKKAKVEIVGVEPIED